MTSVNFNQLYNMDSRLAYYLGSEVRKDLCEFQHYDVEVDVRDGNSSEVRKDLCEFQLIIDKDQ